MTIPQTTVSALILAGRRPDGDALAEAHGQRYKAVLDVAGKPMIQHVLRALRDSECVARVTIYTQEPEHLKAAVTDVDPGSMDVTIAVSAGSLSETVLNHLDNHLEHLPLLITTADNPMLNPEAVTSFLTESGNRDDLAVGVVPQQAVDRLPVRTKRTWLTFSDQSVTGCNLFLMRSAQVRDLVTFWRTLEQQRKKVNHLARKLGIGFLIRYRLGWLSLSDAFAHISARFALSAKAVVLMDGRLAIDADHEADLEAIRALKSEMGPADA